jgi:hypothetical protein
MVQDSLARYAPADSLHTHSCAAALRYRLGFAEAAVFSGRFPGDTVYRVLVVVVEPQDSGRVQAKPAPMDTAGRREVWREATEFARTSPAFMNATLMYASAAGRAPDASVQWAGADSARVRRFWEFLAAHRTQADRAAALASLRGSRNGHDRMIASALLANFASSDTVWWALADALRESDGPVRLAAINVLAGLSRSAPHAVDWGPAASALHPLLDATSPVVLPQLITVLLATGVRSDLAPELLRGGGQTLLAMAGSESPWVRSGARQLLTQLHGSDLGDDMGRWRAWVNSF